MNSRSVRYWAWVGGHRLLAGWAAAVLAIVVFGGGIAMGAARDPQPVEQTLAAQATAVAKRQSTAVEAVVIGVRPSGFVVQTKSGEQVVVRTNEKTKYRQKKQNVEAAAVKRGSRIVVLGRPGARPGMIVAKTVSIRGQLRAALLPPDPGVPSP